jgi:lipoprotein-anchoring transpeptidase ErfK/SrfK
MDRRKFTLAAFAALAAAAATTPAWATLYYNPDTNQWEQRNQNTTNNGPHGHYTPIVRETVDYDTKYKPGTIVVETEERRLYFVLPAGQAIKYGIGVGRDGFRWAGQHAITRKAEWPGWTPPAEMRKRVPDLPAYMPGGPDNPLGARALYIGATLYRLHGTSEPWTIGQAVSSGCIRLTNEDIIDLYDRVKVGSLVVVHQ